MEAKRKLEEAVKRYSEILEAAKKAGEEIRKKREEEAKAPK